MALEKEIAEVRSILKGSPEEDSFARIMVHLNAAEGEIEKLDELRASEWRRRRDAEGSRDAAKAACDTLKGELAEYRRRAELNPLSGLSTTGINIWGDEKSMAAVQRALHLASQEDEWRTQIRHAREYAGKMEAKARTLLDILGPFASFASEAVTDEGVWVDGIGKERICDWLGPSAFVSAKRAFERGMQPPAGEKIRATQDGSMEASPMTGQSPVGEAPTDLSDEDRIAYWKGAYERMAARNVVLTDAVKSSILVLDDVASGQGVDLPFEHIIRDLNAVAHTGGNL